MGDVDKDFPGRSRRGLVGQGLLRANKPHENTYQVLNHA